MRSFFVRVALFWSSFSLVALVVGVSRLVHDPAEAVMPFVVAGLVAAIGWIALVWASHRGDHSGTVRDVEPRGEAIVGYVGSYLLPVILALAGATSDVTVAVAFLVLMSALYALADVHYLNPLLPLAGFRVLLLKVEAGGKPESFIAIARGYPAIGEEVCIMGEGQVRIVRLKRKGDSDCA